VHVTGYVAGDGQTVKFDLVKRGPTDGMCTLTASGETVDVIRVGAYDYARASERFWATLAPEAVRGQAAARLADGKYVKARHTDMKIGRLTKFLDIPQIVWMELGETQDVVKGDRQIVNGVPTIAIVSPYLGTIYIATQGEPYVVRVVAPGGASTGVSNFFDYLKPVQIQAPPASEVVDIAALRPSGR
jgi:hypothetical protein